MRWHVFELMCVTSIRGDNFDVNYALYVRDFRQLFDVCVRCQRQKLKFERNELFYAWQRGKMRRFRAT